MTVKGSKNPIGLYTVDCSVDEISHSLIKIKPIEEVKENMELKKKLIKEMVEDSNCGIKTSDFFEAEKDFVVMLKEAYNVEF